MLNEDAEAAHKFSSNHRHQLQESAICGCFYCLAIYPPSQIKEWTDEVDRIGQAALCPRCGIKADQVSVIMDFNDLEN